MGDSLLNELAGMTKNYIYLFCSFVVTQVASHVSGHLYDRRTAVVVHATSYGLPHFRLENTKNRIFRFPRIVIMVMTCEVWMSIFLTRMLAEVKNCQKYALFYTT
jgi:hypothetical protein